MYQCCIFDLDGTLVNSLRSIEHTLNMTLKEFDMGPVGDKQVKEFVGNGYKELIERSLKYCGDNRLMHAEQAFQLYLENFKKYCIYEMTAYDGVRELLAQLKEHQIKLAVLSNKVHDRVVQSAEEVFGQGYFDLVYGERDDVKIKPDPEGILLIMEELQLKPEQCLYFGDTSTDMKTGQAAGVDTVGVTWGFRDRAELEQFSPKYIIDHPSQIIDKIIG